MFVSSSSIYRYLYNQLNYIILAECRELFKSILFEIIEHMEMLVLIDETHKDKNASRRRRSCGRKWVKLELSQWFEDTVKYTLIVVKGFNGFIPEPYCLVCRHTSEVESTMWEGSAGTVTQEWFLKFVKDDLCPIFGRFEHSEKQSIVLMDNVSVHILPEVNRAISACGVYLVYTISYSTDLIQLRKMCVS